MSEKRRGRAVSVQDMSARPERVELTRHAIRQRAMGFANSHANDSSEAAGDRSSWNDLFAVLDGESRRLGASSAQRSASRPGVHGWIDLLVPGEMAVEHKSRGENLDHAMTQLFDYLDDLPSAQHPGLVVCLRLRDFYCRICARRTERAIHSLRTGQSTVELFCVAGHGESSVFADEEEANLVATGLHGDTSRRRAREWVRPTRVTRMVDPNTFLSLRGQHERVGQGRVPPPRSPQHQPGRLDLGPRLAYLFQLLNTPPERLPTNLDETSPPPTPAVPPPPPRPPPR